MDYEKKYNEALSKCKAYIDDTEKRWSEEFSRATEEVFKEVFPELRESEDERIRKGLIKLLTVASEAYLVESTGINKDAFLAWLEKQKEKLGDISTILLIKREIDRRKEAWSKSRKEAVALDCHTLADDAAVRIEELNSIIAFLGTIRCDSIEKQKEQKPQSVYVDCTEHPEWYGMPAKEQKPAEWNPNNEDVILFNKAVTTNPNLTPSERAKLDIIRTKFKHCNGNITKPTEWSEEDERMLNRIIETLSMPPIYDTKACAKMVSWLKSLRPQPHWKPSEEHKEPEYYQHFDPDC